jgi:tRNA 2-thiocytidine biosynthesis protein TtcA
VKALLAELSAEHPAVKGNLLHALARVVPSHLLDRALAARLEAATGQDPWIDEEEDSCVEGAGEVVKLSNGR